MTSFYLGLDAGNSKTVALVADSHGQILGRGRSGVGDIYGVRSEGEAVEQVLLALNGALTAAGLAIGDLDRAALRLAGVDWPEDETFWHQALATRLAGLDPGRVSIKNDGFALLRCGEVCGAGVALTAGTGPAVAARGWDGQEYCASFWIQHELGGEGLGNAAFRAVVDAELGLAPPTALRGELLQLFGYPDVTAMLHGFTRRSGGRAQPRRTAARTVLRLGAAGDAVALAIVAQQGSVFARLARIAADRTGLTTEPDRPVPVVLGGSVLTSEYPVYRHALIRSLSAELGRVATFSPAVSPVAGALLDALAEGQVQVDEAMQRRVLHAVHPTDFLLT